MVSENLMERSRRDFLRMTGAGVFGASASGWMNVLAAHAAQPGKKPKKIKHTVLLWMDGGPSHKDTWDLKPDSDGAGEFKPISTSVPGIQISEHLPKMAKLMQHGAIVRGMSTKEGAHPRAKYNMHTGYREGQGGMNYPSLGAIVSMEKGIESAALPNYVTIAGRAYGSAYLGPKHQPLVITDATKGVEDLKPLVAQGQFDKRVSLLQEMEASFFRNQSDEVITDHKTNYLRAVKLMQSKEAKAFDLSLEPAAARTPYGTGKFADGCLMARRLIEVGVPFVEVALGGWDTHQDNFTKVKALSEQVDAGMSALINDLQKRGLLDQTLIIWMGDFGRTPKINTKGPKPGRDHYPKAWSLAMFGGGMQGGQVIGRTDKQGATVEDRPVSAIDFMATVCTMLGIDHNRQIDTPSGRPIRIVDKGSNPITQLIG